jgi:hypothetical protein
MKSRRMRWARHVARMGQMRNVYSTLVGKTEGKCPLGRHSCRWRMTLGWMLGKKGGRMWIGRIWLRIGTSGELL